MIKNILYSLFLHFLLITLIYANFNLREVPKVEVKEISISLLEVKAEQNIDKEPVNDKKPTDKKIAPKKPEQKKEEPKKKPQEKKPIKEEKKEQPQEKKKEEVKKQEPTKKEVTKQILDDKPKKDEEDKEKEIKKEEPKKEEEKKEIIEEPKKEEEIKEIKADLKEDEQSLNNLENLNLSVREKFNIRSQLKMCYRRARAEHKLEKSQFKITIIAEIAQDGFIHSNLEEITDNKKYKEDRDYKTAINVVERAINLCNPLRNLPSDKYNIWKKVLLEFGEDSAKTIQDEKN